MKKRRVYYDHEPVYRQIAASDGHGWDDREGGAGDDSYDGCKAFIAEHCAGRAIHGVLDLGCGGGQAGLLFAELSDTIVGVDFSETAIALANNNASAMGLSAAHFVVGDCTRHVVEPGSADVVLDNHALHCLIDDPDRAGFLAAARAALRERGLFFCETMSREGLFEPARFGASAPEFVSGSRTRRWVSLSELNRELAAAGFVVVEQRLRRQPDAPEAGDLVWTVAKPD